MVDQLTSLPRSVLMVETSGASSLNPRQACSVEAAARRSVMTMVMMMVMMMILMIIMVQMVMVMI